MNNVINNNYSVCLNTNIIDIIINNNCRSYNNNNNK